MCVIKNFFIFKIFSCPLWVCAKPSIAYKLHGLIIYRRNKRTYQPAAKEDDAILLLSSCFDLSAAAIVTIMQCATASISKLAATQTIPNGGNCTLKWNWKPVSGRNKVNVLLLLVQQHLLFIYFVVLHTHITQSSWNIICEDKTDFLFCCTHRFVSQKTDFDVNKR